MARKDYSKKYYQRNKEKIKKRTNQYYHLNKDKIRKYRETDHYRDLKRVWNKKYYEKNKYAIKRQYKEYRIRNRERYNETKRRYNKTPQRKQYLKTYHEKYYAENLNKIKNYHRKYQSRYRTKYNLYQQKRRIKSKFLIHDFTDEEWLKKLKATKGICPECHIFVGIKNLTLDHRPPISKVKKGFVYTIDDVRPLCKKCNSKLGNR